MGGFAKGGVVIPSGSNLAIAGVKPSGVAVQGQVIWSAEQWQFLLGIAAPAANNSITSSIDTTGANLLVFFSTRLTAATSYPKSDSANNVWMLGVSVASGAYTSEVFYCIRPLTSTQHVFQATSSNVTTVLVAAFKAPLSFAFDQQSSIGAVSNVSSIQLPEITPSAPDSLVITSLAAGWGAYVTINSIDSSFFILGEKVTQTPAAALQALAYNVVPNAAPVAPTWSMSPADRMIATMMNFIPSPWQLLGTLTATAQAPTTTPIDTTGATLFVAMVNYYGYVASTITSDTYNNTWIAGPAVSQGNSHIATFYVINPNTGPDHTFTCSSGSYTTAIVQLAKCASPITLDQSSTTNTIIGTNSVQLPAITPSANQSLIVTSILAPTTAGTPSVDSNFGINKIMPYVAGQNLGGSIATLIQGAAGSVSPTWAVTGGAAVMLSFIPAPLWQLVASTQGVYTTSAIDTTGATLLIVVCAQYGNNSVSDSEGNSWTLGVNLPTASGYTSFSTIYYCINPLTNTAHTFYLSGAYSSFFVLAFKGPNCVADQQGTTTNAGQPSTLTLPSISVPAGSLVISGVLSIDSILSIDSNFSITGISSPASPMRTGAAAYLLTDVAAPAIAPTWTITTPSLLGIAGATMLSFIPAPSLPWQLLSSASIVAPAQASAAIDTTGAKLIVATIAYSTGATGFQFTDSENNTWLLGATSDSTATAVRTATYYCINPTTSSSHTFSNTGSALYASAYVAAFQGPANIAFDQATSNSYNLSNYYNVLPAITPSANNSLLVTGIGLNATAGAIDSGFAITGSYPFVNGVVFGGAMAYLIQTTAAAVSPTWTLSAGTAVYYSAAVMLSFTGA